MTRFPSMDTEVERTLAHVLAHRRCDLAFAYAKENDMAPCGRENSNPWSQNNVAKRVGVSTTTLWKWEGGMSCPRMAMMLRWCGVLNTDFMGNLAEALRMVEEGKGR